MRRNGGVWGVILLLVVAFVSALWWREPLSSGLTELVGTVHELGVVGAVAFVGLYVAITVAALPASIITLAAGLFYGPYGGAALVLVSSVTGAVCAFLLARTWLRPMIERRFGSGAVLQYLVRESERDGMRLVFLLRLSPVVPFSLLNYTLGLTGVTLRDYILASVIGMIPGILLYSHLGASLRSLSSVSGASAPGWLFWVGIGATFLATLVLGRWSANALRLARSEAP